MEARKLLCWRLVTNFIAASKKSPDDIVIVASVRTPIGKAKRGGFKDADVDVLAAPVIAHILKTTKIDPKSVGDVVFGVVLPRGGQVTPFYKQFFK